MAKQIESVLAGTALIDPTKIDDAMSGTFDAARQRFWDAVDARTQAAYKGPLAIMRNIGETLPMLQTAMTAQYGLDGDPALPHKALSNIGDPYPVALFDYLAAKAPQIRGLT